MLRGLYTSGWGMMALTRKMDVVANNMANTGTRGYKKDTVVFEGFHDLLIQRINDPHYTGRKELGTAIFGSDTGLVHTDFGQGQLERTGNTLDIAINNGISGNTGFFVIGVNNGEGGLDTYYTRDGSFSVSSNNYLVTKEGHIVMGEDGPIELFGDDFTVMEDGTVMQDGIEAGRILVVEFADTSDMRKVGNSLYRTEADAVPGGFTGTLVQGFVEMSNVNVVKEMVEMISVMRAYEANQKMLQVQDETLGRAVNEVGAVR